MKKNIVYFFMLILTGCASLMNGESVIVPIYTTPAGATLKVNGNVYTTPVKVALPRGEGDYTLNIEKEGYQTINVHLSESLDAWLWGNIIFGIAGGIGVVIDLISGDAYDLDPERLDLYLQGNFASKRKDGGLEILLVELNSLPQEVIKDIKLNSKKFKTSKF